MKIILSYPPTYADTLQIDAVVSSRVRPRVTFNVSTPLPGGGTDVSDSVWNSLVAVARAVLDEDTRRQLVRMDANPHRKILGGAP